MEKERKNEKLLDKAKEQFGDVVRKGEDVFIKAEHLTKEQLNAFDKIPVKLTKNFNSKNRNQISTISVSIDAYFMPKLIIKPGNQYLSSDMFNLLLMELNAPLIDKLGRDKTEWNYLVPYRFIEGNFKTREGKYHSIELFFKQDFVVQHFFDYFQDKIISKLADNKKIKFEYRPDAIDIPEAVENVEL